MSNPTQQLEQLVEAIEQAGADIAPSYQEYMPLAFAIANDCGEAGRPLFHRICRLSAKYRHDDAEKMYTNALASGRGKNTLGTVWHLAEKAGITKLSFTPPPPSHTHVPYNAPEKTPERGDPEKPSEEEPEGAALPPPFPEYRWPRFLQQAIDCGETKAQRDILLLGTLTTLGATLGSLVRFNYGHKEHYPCLQTFILALPASGKGALAWARQLAEPIHQEMLATYQQKMKNYQAEKRHWDFLGKKRADHPEPEQPRRKLFFIAGDNSGTGIQENLIDNNGAGMICESEADTVSTAIGADYGHWSHTLRNAFDHDRLAYNRRTNHEYRECGKLTLGVLLSGTPAQLCPLIPSPENGLFSRQLFYYMPPIREWVSQFDNAETDYGRQFHQWGTQWKAVLEAVKAETGGFCLQLSATQQEAFNHRLAQVFSHAGAAHGSHMRSTVARIAINVCRIMSVVAWLRALETVISLAESDPKGLRASLGQLLRGCPGLSPSTHTPGENLADGMTPSFRLAIAPDDFEAVMALVEPLYRHSCHVLMFLPDAGAAGRKASPREVFLSSLPLAFTRREAMEVAVRNGISENTFDTLLKRMAGQGTIESTGRGNYRFTSHVREGSPAEGQTGTKAAAPA